CKRPLPVREVQLAEHQAWHPGQTRSQGPAASSAPRRGPGDMRMLPSGAESSSGPEAEKPAHERYLQDFRVEQCPYFPNYKCQNHKPYTCFYWHFPNQRRRRPTLTPEGMFNYSPDVYCNKYDEITGVCSGRDDCTFLHRTLGDTERRYHPRYYKTVLCVHEVGAQGHCSKNGPHCAFAHGLQDLRNPVYGTVECRILRLGLWLPPECWATFLHEDPSWQDVGFVLAHYKVQPCLRPPHLGVCRMGLACPNFHDRRDRRRSPACNQYSSTPCPSVRQGTEWTAAGRCAEGDQCGFCHGRTEQKFHPEIYKSTMCNDLQRTNYCPRGPFCSFAHSENEMVQVRKAYNAMLFSAFSDNTNLALPVDKSPPASTAEDLSVALVPFAFDPTPGAGRPALEAPSISRPESPSAASEGVPSQGKDEETLVELVSSVINSVISSSDLHRDVDVELGGGCTEYCYQAPWLTRSWGSLTRGVRNVWDPSGIWADQSLQLPKSCLMCATWKREARASARREQLAEQEKQRALVKLGELEKRLNDTVRPKSVLDWTKDKARREPQLWEASQAKLRESADQDCEKAPKFGSQTKEKA
ncbi:unnamed protein product, partial [Ixodes hexagonus]